MPKKWLVKLMREWLEKSGACHAWGKIENQDQIHFRITWRPTPPVCQNYYIADFTVDSEILFDASVLRNYVIEDMTKRYRRAIEEKRQEYYLQWNPGKEKHHERRDARDRR